LQCSEYFFHLYYYHNKSYIYLSNISQTIVDLRPGLLRGNWCHGVERICLVLIVVQRNSVVSAGICLRANGRMLVYCINFLHSQYKISSGLLYLYSLLLIIRTFLCQSARAITGLLLYGISTLKHATVCWKLYTFLVACRVKIPTFSWVWLCGTFHWLVASPLIVPY
jgi:hypothetical protein